MRMTQRVHRLEASSDMVTAAQMGAVRRRISAFALAVARAELDSSAEPEPGEEERQDVDILKRWCQQRGISLNDEYVRIWEQAWREGLSAEELTRLENPPDAASATV